jgi:hypothetical protein
MVRRPWRLLAAAVLLAWGCAQPGSREKAGGLLRESGRLPPLTIPPDGVALDVVFVRRPLGDPEMNQQLHADVDEQVLEPPLRDSLARNGLWVGLAGDPLPRSLESLLGLDDEKEEKEEQERPESNAKTEAQTGDPQDVTLVPLVPKVSGQYVILDSAKPTELLTRNDTYAECFVLVWRDERLVGEQFENAQCVLVVTPHREPDGRVKLEFLPQVRYGQPRVEHAASSDGTWRFAAQRPRRSFHELAWEVTVSPHEMVLVTCLPNLEASLGYHMFTAPLDDSTQQNLIAVRLSDLGDQERVSFSAP